MFLVAMSVCYSETRNALQNLIVIQQDVVRNIEIVVAVVVVVSFIINH